MTQGTYFKLFSWTQDLSFPGIFFELLTYCNYKIYNNIIYRISFKNESFLLAAYYHIPLSTLVGSTLCMRIIHGAGYSFSASAIRVPLNRCAWFYLPILLRRDIGVVCIFFVVQIMLSPLCLPVQTHVFP